MARGSPILADIVDRQTRSRMMSGIRGKDTRPELRLRKALFAKGFRYRVNDRRLPGRPDLVFPRYRAVVMVHGCFWHHHENCRFATVPATRPEFWQAKFEANRRRDRVVLDELAAARWRCAIVWECGLKGPQQVEATVETISGWLNSGEPGDASAAVLPTLEISG